MAVLTFDTLKFANTLKAAGVPPQQAEAQASAFAEVIQVNLKDMTTKDDLASTASDLKREIADLGKDLKQEIADLRKDAKQENADLRKDVKQESRELEQRLNTKIDNVHAELKEQIAHMKGELHLVRWMLGTLIGGVAAVLIRLFFFHGPI